ncbi:MAG: cupin domain-containing protein [Sphingobacteriales bacterium]
MAINIYDICTNPVTGETFKVVSVTPYSFTMRWTVKPGGHTAFEHIHYKQDEIFRVKKGELRILIEGKEHIVSIGNMIIVPKGKRHIVYNNSHDVLDTNIELRPVLDHPKITQCFNGLLSDGHVDEKGAINMPMMLYFLQKMKCKGMARPSGISASTFKFLLIKYYLLGTFKGWDKLYDKYTK